jgi:UDP-N-acetylmuramate dehydrogenase
MSVRTNYPLKSYNTFGIEATAKYFAAFDSVDTLKKLLDQEAYKNEKLLVLGGGSNLLFTSDFFDGFVLHNQIKGIRIEEENETSVVLTSGAGEQWHDLVLYSIRHNWGGLENLSLIPGTVGAAPMQNIGAYGAELKDIFVHLDAYELATGRTRRFDLAECRFGYRTSIFKQEARNQYIITSVSLRLSKKPVFNTSYGAIADTLQQMGITELSVKNISDAVIQIRRSKLPDPKEIGNAGSFFKNPEIPQKQFEKLKILYPTIPSYPTLPGYTKVPAGWLIEQCGWKGKIVGQTGIHKNQALVLVNHGQASGAEVKALSQEVQKSVHEKFGIALETEVNFV